LCVLALFGALLVSGCALRDPRDSYAYGRSDGLWDADYDLLLDWNYPTSANQGPLEGPKRFRAEKPAIGVPWATGNPSAPPSDKAQAPGLEPSATPAHEGSDDEHEADAAPGSDAGSSSRVPVDLQRERASR
jgi:hypothetical protein